MGDFAVHSAATLDSETSTLLMNGTGTITPGSDDLYNIIISADGIVVDGAAFSFNVCTVYGTYTASNLIQGVNLSSYGTVTANASIDLTGILELGTGGSITSDTVTCYGTSGAVEGLTATSLLILEATIVSDGSYSNVTATTFSSTNASDSSCVIAGTHNAIVFSNTNGTLTITGTASVTGDVSSSGAADINMSGAIVKLVGTSTQTVTMGSVITAHPGYDGPKSSGNVILADGTISIISGGYLRAGDVNVASGANITGDGELGVTSITSNGVIDPAALRLIDWTDTIPVWTGSIGFESSGAIGDITIQPTGTKHWVGLKLLATGDDDLIFDCSAFNPTLYVSGDISVIETSTGVVRWVYGTGGIILNGAGTQVVALSLSEEEDGPTDSIYVANTTGTVYFTEDVWVSGYDEADGATVIGKKYLHTPFSTYLENAITTKTVGNNSSARLVELMGGSVIEPTAFEPDPRTHRGDYYYNATLNVLFKKIVTRNDGVIAAYWQKVSN